jgi:tetraacyldisaccharide 4'-kinase
MKPLRHSFIPDIVSNIFGGIVAVRNALYDARPDFSKNTGRPTISIGGLSAGGTGKTPMTLLVAQHFHRKGREVVFLSRGYGRETKKIVVSPPGAIDTWKNVGDEPAMLHAAIPQSWLGIGGSRHAVLQSMISRLSPKAVYILDDAFQHRQLKRDMDIVCLPPDPFNDRLLPSGTLREPLGGLKRAHCLCLIGTIDDIDLLKNSRQKIAKIFSNIPVFILYQVPLGWVNLSTNEFQTLLPIKMPVAVCGIARPQRFIFLLKKLSISTSAESIFSDHHVYKEHDIASIMTKSGSSGIVTTEKDAFRLKSLKRINRENIWYLKLNLHFSEEKSEHDFYQFIDKAIY